LRVDRIDAGWRSWTNEKSLWHRVCLHPAFVEGLCPAPYGAPVHSLAASAPGDPERTNDNLEPPLGAQVKRIGGSLPTAPTLGLAPPGYEILPLRGWQKPLQDPTPVERARTVTRMAGVLNHAFTSS